jgi:hypothetical protein
MVNLNGLMLLLFGQKNAKFIDGNRTSSFINSATTCNMMAFMRFCHGLVDSSHACHFEYIGKVYKHEKTKH